MRLILDSSVFISFFNDTDVFHRKTEAFLKKIIKKQGLVIILPVLIFLEILHILYKQLSKFDEKTVFTIFSKYEKVDISFTLVPQILPLLKELDLKTSDAIIVALTKLFDATLITWDKKIINQAKEVIKVKTPPEI